MFKLAVLLAAFAAFAAADLSGCMDAYNAAVLVGTGNDFCIALGTLNDCVASLIDCKSMHSSSSH
jgi:hypothetical protein